VGLRSPDGDWETHTNAEGKFVLEGIPPGTYELDALAEPAWGFSVITDFKVGPADTAPVLLKMFIGMCAGGDERCAIPRVNYRTRADHKYSRAAVLEGRVFSLPQPPACQGVVLKKTVVSASRSFDQPPLATTTTDRKGRFRFVALEPGRYFLSFDHISYCHHRVYNVRVKPHQTGEMNEYLQDNRECSAVVADCQPPTR
jgi:hypothetical protein